MIHDMNKPGGLYKSSSPFHKDMLKFLSYVFRKSISKSFLQKPLVSEINSLKTKSL